MNSQEELRFLLNQLGEFGKYQLIQHVLHCSVWLTAAIHMYAFVFVFPTMEHHCNIPKLDGNLTPISTLEKYIPTMEDGKFASCEKFKIPNLDNSTTPCGNDGYIYNSSYYESSRVIEWNMVCEREWMRALLLSAFLFGTLLGAFVGGILADKYGRKPVFYYSGVISVFCGLGLVFLDNYYAVIISTMLYGVFGAGSTNAPAVALTMELVGSSRRNLCGTAFSFSFGLGGVICAIIGYFLPSNARLLQLVYVLHSVFLLGYWWLLDESVSWLWSRGKYDEATKVLEKAAKMNGITLSIPEGLQKTSSTNLGSGRRSTLTEIIAVIKKSEGDVTYVFRTPEIRKRAIAMMLTWFSTGVLYYGLSYNSVNLFGNPYLIFIISCLAEFPAHPISIFLMPKFGYKPMVYMNLLLPGITCVVLAFLPTDITTTSVAMLAKISATVVFDTLNAYTAELFPTVVRNTAMGLCVMAARLGATVVPQISLLTAISDKLPNVISGGTAIVASFVVFIFLPETMGKPIPQTIRDVENCRKEEFNKVTESQTNNGQRHGITHASQNEQGDYELLLKPGTYIECNAK